MPPYPFPEAANLAPEDISTFREALTALATIRRTETNSVDWLQLASLMIAACTNAAAWNPATDPFAIERRRDQAFLDDLPSAGNSLVKLLDFAARHPRGFNTLGFHVTQAVGLTADHLRAAGFQYDENNAQAGPFLRTLLAALQSEIEREKSSKSRRAVKGKLASGGSRRVIVGALKFPVFIDARRRLTPV